MLQLTHTTHTLRNWWSTTKKRQHKQETNFEINKQILFIQLKSRLRSGNLLLLKRQENSYLSSITPPGIKRKSFPEVWNNMQYVLEEADEIVAIGFSFNDNDKYIKEEFSGIKFKKDLKIIIISPSNEKLKNIYETVFYTDNICTKYKTFSEYCQWIIRPDRA